MLRKFTRWFRPRLRPTPQGFPLARAYLCTVCQEVSNGRQSKCLLAHTYKIVHLASYLDLHTHRIHEKKPLDNVSFFLTGSERKG